eukprot:5894982-Prymnesium_polylepis.1
MMSSPDSLDTMRACERGALIMRRRLSVLAVRSSRACAVATRDAHGLLSLTGGSPRCHTMA